MPRIWIAFLMMVPCLFVQGHENNCQEVGGAILTNFLTPTTTLGTATGDLKGGIGVDELSTSSGQNGSQIIQTQPHWVTESGDTIFLAPSAVTVFPPSVDGLSVASYIKGVTITGGTGRFDGAHGTLAVFGAVDLNQHQIILRYQGIVCFAKPKD
jgi:hypothetical protein